MLVIQTRFFKKSIESRFVVMTERLEAVSVIILCYSLVLSCGHEKIVFSKISLDSSFLQKGRCDDFKLFVIEIKHCLNIIDSIDNQIICYYIYLAF